MNYLAHLYFAQPNADSHMGNLLGDFRKGAQLDTYSQRIKLGLQNHYLVDKFTDSHPLIKQAKQLFKKEHRRFSGIAIDVLFDHFLIAYWSTYQLKSDVTFNKFKTQSYHYLLVNKSIMPERMQRVVTYMTTDDWFEQYRELDGIARALINIAKRIRFDNDFHHIVDDVYLHYQTLDQIFHQFFPDLAAHVEQSSPEIIRV